MPARKRFLILLLMPLLLLCGCTTSIGLPITDGVPAVTLPPAEVSYVAPIGDAALEYTDTATLYLPSHDGIGLTAIESELSFSLVRPAAETVVRSLLAYAGGKQAAPLGGSVKLSLYGANPVEVSRNTVTVNLSASALQLDREALFIVCQAITNTLTELDGISYVNVLVVDKPIGLDIANTLPMGALQKSNESDLSAVYGQMLSRRTTAGSHTDPAFSAAVPLYFPLQNSDGLVCEVRSISFENQRIPDMVSAILRELAAGPSDPSIISPPLPLLADMLNTTPTLEENSTAGGMFISLDFAHNLDDMLEAYGITRKQCTASLCYTLSSFFPNVNGVSLSISGVPVDSLLLTEEDANPDPSPSLRSEFSGLIYDYCTLYFADEEMKTLCSTQRALPYYQRSNPRILLCELAKGPLPGDSNPQLRAIMEPGAITDTTILGFSLSGKTLLSNFAPAFRNACEGLQAQEERLFAYGLVNTLCMSSQVQNVCFFLSGTQFDGFSGEIYWRGLFQPLPV